MIGVPAATALATGNWSAADPEPRAILATSGGNDNFHQDLNGDGVIGVPAGTAAATGNLPAADPAPQAILATFGGNDNFVFLAASPSVSAAPHGSIGLNDFSSVAGDTLAAVFHGVGQPQTPSLLPGDGGDLLGDHGNPVPATSLHLAELHASDFFIR